MAEEGKKGKKKKKSVKSIIMAVLSPFIMIILIAAFFFGVLQAIVEIILKIILAILKGILGFLSDPIGWIESMWATFTNWLEGFGFGDGEFDELEFEHNRVEPSVAIDLKAFNDMKESLGKAINLDTLDLDDVTLKKMLMAYYSGIYLSDTDVLIQLTEDEEASMDPKPYKIIEGDEEKGKGYDGVKYLCGKGLITLNKPGVGQPIYYGEDILKEIYKEHYKSRLDDYYSEDDPKKRDKSIKEYADSALAYLKKCYTYGQNGIKCYVETRNDTEEIIKYSSNAEVKMDTSDTTSSYSLVDMEYYSKVAEYVIPMEFMVDLLTTTGSLDFVEAFIETVKKETEINLELITNSYSEEEKTEIKTNRETVIESEEKDSYDVFVYVGFDNVQDIKLADIFEIYEQNLSVAFGKATLKNDGDKKIYKFTIPTSSTGSLDINDDAGNKLFSVSLENGSESGKINISVSDVQNVGIKTKIVAEFDGKVDSSIIELTNSNSWTHKWENLDKKYKVEKKDTADVKYVKTKKYTEYKYDFVLTKMKNWYMIIEEKSGSPKQNTVSTYISVDENGEEVVVADKNSAIEVQQPDFNFEIKDDNNSKTTQFTGRTIFWDSISNPYTFLLGDWNETYFLQRKFGYILYGDEFFYNIHSFDPDVINLMKVMKYTDSNVTKSVLKTTTVTSTTEVPMTVKDNTNLFLGLLSNDTGTFSVGANFKPKSSGGKVVRYPDVYSGKTGVGELLENGAEMFFDLLDESEYTQGLTDIMRYIMYRYSGNNYGITSLDFNIFNPTNFDSISGNTSETLKAYIHYWENSGGAPMNADGTKYIIHDDGYGNATVGYGVDIINGGHKQAFLDAGYPITIGGEVDIEFVDNLEEQEISSNVAKIEAIAAGLNLEEYQIQALVSRAYNCGPGSLTSVDSPGAVGIRNGKNFVEAYQAYWDPKKDDRYKLKEKTADFNHKLYTEYMSAPTTANGKFSAGLERRRKSEWQLFQTGYYGVLKLWYPKGGNIVEAADEIHRYMEENNYTYCAYGANSCDECGTYGKEHGLDRTFEASKDGYHNTCCATYVSWVLQKSGHITESEHTNSASALATLLAKKGWKRIDDTSKLEAGDICFYSGHTNIYAGDGKVYDAGSGKLIRGEGNCASPMPEEYLGMTMLYAYRAQ